MCRPIDAGDLAFARLHCKGSAKVQYVHTRSKSLHLQLFGESADRRSRIAEKTFSQHAAEFFY
jgi:hypothetical protein